MTITAMWSRAAGFAATGVVGAGAGGVVGMAAGVVGATVTGTVTVDDGEAVAAGVALTVGLGVDVATGVCFVQAARVVVSSTTAVTAMVRRASVTEQFPSAVDEAVPDELVLVGDARGAHEDLQALLQVRPGLLQPGGAE